MEREIAPTHIDPPVNKNRTIWLIALATGVYIFLFFILYDQIGPTLISITLLPVLTAAWFLGTRGGLIAGILSIPVNLFMLVAFMQEDIAGTFIRGIPGYLVLTLAGGVVGALSEILKRVRLQTHELERERAALQEQIKVRKEVENTLRRSEKRFRDLFENSPDAIIVQSYDGYVLDANPIALAFHDTPHADLIGRHAAELVPDDFKDETRGRYPMSLEEGVVQFEGQIMSKEGRIITTETRVSPIDYRGEPAILLHERDISIQKKAQQAMTLAFDQALEASRFKSQILAKVSHELRTPLNSILGFAEILQLGLYGDLSEKQRNTLEDIIQSTDDLVTLISHMLDSAQIETGKLKVDIRHFDIRAVLDRVLVKMSVLAEQKKLDLRSEISPHIPRLLPGDPLRIEQILINLINNAIKFTDYGEVNVRVFTDEQDFWGIEVRDTGFGIPDEMKLTIFEPFSQVDSSETRLHGGTGLGLSIVHELTTMMGGRINLESKEGEGSTFTVTLPIDTKEETNE